MSRYKLTISDLELEYFNNQIAKIKERNKKNPTAFEDFFSDVWNDMIESFSMNHLDSFTQETLSEVKFLETKNRVRDFEILAELNTYTLFNLFTETYLEASEDFNTALFNKYLKDFLEKEVNVEHVEKIKLTKED